MIMNLGWGDHEIFNGVGGGGGADNENGLELRGGVCFGI